MNFRTFLIAIFGIALLSPACAQNDAEKAERESPPVTVKQKVGDATITINYGQPSVKDREIFGGLVPYDQIWRTGANEATTFETNKDLVINDKTLPAGKYALFTIPGEDEWTVIFNSVHDQWGAYKYEQEKDVLRITVKPKEHEQTEKMTFLITEDGVVSLQWDETRVPFTIKS